MRNKKKKKDEAEEKELKTRGGGGEDGGVGGGGGGGLLSWTISLHGQMVFFFFKNKRHGFKVADFSYASFRIRELEKSKQKTQQNKHEVFPSLFRSHPETKVAIRIARLAFILVFLGPFARVVRPNVFLLLLMDVLVCVLKASPPWDP